jgi:hypothetical protein
MTGHDDGPAELQPADPEPPPAGAEPQPADADASVTDAMREPRPWIERIGLAGIAIVMDGLFGTVGVAAWYGGEGFLAAMGAIGCLMTLWVGALTVIRG